jgi:hypothetical protein
LQLADGLPGGIFMTMVKYDETGKISLDGIYDRPDPRAYFGTLSKLDYVIPQRAKPVFERLIAARRAARGRRHVKIVDLGCSYGVNAALLKHGLSMAELYRLYAVEADRARLIARDRRLFRRNTDPDLELVGIDQAGNAVAYAVDTGALDAGIATNLERVEPSAQDRIALAEADLIISTGCFGYVTHTSLERILDAAGGSTPWMAHFVLRMFDFDLAERMLAGHGYVTEKANGLFRQRRFATPEEGEHVLDNLAARGIDPAGAEATGWYHAELFIARPKADAERMSLERLLGEAGEMVQ